jgi:nitrite reductase/ring-hydroxylating ferredoxin subunit
LTNKDTQLRLVLKKITAFSLLIVAVLLTYGCGKTPLDRNPYLVDIRFQRTLNLALPLYSGLNYTGNSLLIEDLGINGVIVFNLSGTTFLAWEATCPNHLPESCSKLTLKGVLAVCSCEDYQYSLATGQLLNPSEELNPPQSLLFYQVDFFDGLLSISN